MDTSKIHTIFANGGIITTTDGTKMYYDYHKDVFCCILPSGSKKEFKEITELAVFVSFSNCQIAYKEKPISRSEWFVLTYDKVHATFPSKQLSISFCSRMNDDKRTNKVVTKIASGVYEYTGPKRTKFHLHFYIGSKKSLIENGFKEIIAEWEKRQVVQHQQEEQLKQMQQQKKKTFL